MPNTCVVFIFIHTMLGSLRVKHVFGPKRPTSIVPRVRCYNDRSIPAPLQRVAIFWSDRQPTINLYQGVGRDCMHTRYYTGAVISQLQQPEGLQVERHPWDTSHGWYRSKLFMQPWDDFQSWLSRHRGEGQHRAARPWKVSKSAIFVVCVPRCNTN